MDINKMLALLTSQQDQDIEHAKAWWRESSPEDLLHIWTSVIQADYEDDVDMEIMSRFAAIGFSLIAERMGESQK